jgi:hypothetical protein
MTRARARGGLQSFAQIRALCGAAEQLKLPDAPRVIGWHERCAEKMAPVFGARFRFLFVVLFNRSRNGAPCA